MDNKLDEQLLILQATIDARRKAYDEKIKKQDSKLDMLTSMVRTMINCIHILNSLPDKKDSPKEHYPTTTVPTNKKSPQLEGGRSTKIGGMWNIKHEIRSPKL